MISAITLAELSVGPHVTRDDAERSARQQHLQQAEADFDVLPFDGDCARAFGAVAAALRASGRKPAARAYDALIAASAIANACRYTHVILPTSQESRGLRSGRSPILITIGKTPFPPAEDTLIHLKQTATLPVTLHIRSVVAPLHSVFRPDERRAGLRRGSARQGCPRGRRDGRSHH